MSHILEELSPVFYPRSIAVVGASSDPSKGGNFWFTALIQAGFKGRAYPVNRSGAEVSGVKGYQSLLDIPEPVEHVVVATPAITLPAVLEDCIAKGVKVVQMFTAGFRELRGAEGLRQEEEMVAKARKGGIRLLGPNCIGSLCIAVNKPWVNFPRMHEGGPVALSTQGGSVATACQPLLLERGVPLGKGIHYGNGCDLNILDFLRYFSEDPETKLIGCYVEGVREGRRLFQVLREVTPGKPVVFWKGGGTEAGAKVAASHTGALAASPSIWRAALRQAGAIEVRGLEEMADCLVALHYLSPFIGRQAAFICGFADGGGGQSVAAADAWSQEGMGIASLSPRVREGLASILGEVGSILVNPIDISQRQYDFPSVEKACRLALTDPNVDIIIPVINVDVVVAIFGKEGLEQVAELLIRLKREQEKPVAAILPSALDNETRAWLVQLLQSQGIPVFYEVVRAARAISRVRQYFLWLQRLI